jgi:hypothetical protein
MDDFVRTAQQSNGGVICDFVCLPYHILAAPDQST